MNKHTCLTQVFWRSAEAPRRPALLHCSKIALSSYQLEVCDAHGTFVIHLPLMLVPHQALHQISCVNLIISHVLTEGGREREGENESEMERNMDGLAREKRGGN